MQDHALASGQDRNIFQREHEQVTVLSNNGDAVAGRRYADGGADATGRQHDLAAGTGLGDHICCRDPKPASIVRCKQEMLVRHMHGQCHDILVVGKIDHQAQGFAMTAPARQLVCLQGKEAAIGREDQNAISCLGLNQKPRTVAVLELQVLYHRRDGP